jgi:DNA replication protein DnaC
LKDRRGAGDGQLPRRFRTLVSPSLMVIDEIGYRPISRTGALIDRLLHHCHIVNIRGNSYRVRHHRDLAAPHAEPPAITPPSKRGARRHEA